MLIGLVGHAGAGKDTIANILVNGWNFERLSHATALKDGVAAMFNLDRAMLEGDTEESRSKREEVIDYWTDVIATENPAYGDGNGKITGRNLLTDIGVLMRTHVCPSFWIFGIRRKIKQFMDQGKNVVVTDVRFPNEFINIKNLGGIIIRVKKGDDPEWLEDGIYTAKQHMTHDPEHDSKYPNLPHISEWAWLSMLDQIDVLMENNGTVEELKHQVTNWMNKL